MSGFKINKGLIQKTPIKTQRAPIKFDYMRFGKRGGKHITEMQEFQKTAKRAVEAHDMLMEGKSDLLKDKNVVMTGWKMESPYISMTKLSDIEQHANKLAKEIDVFWSCGIGGSYLGNRATIEAVRGSLEFFNLLSREQREGTPQVFFFGQNMDSGYMANALKIMEGKNVGGAVISKSGGTVEPAIAFAIIKAAMEGSYTGEEAARRIVAITDARKGALRPLAEKKGYATYVVPNNVGGRYSVTSPVGLFTLAAGGVNIKEFILGARVAEEETRKQPFEKNIAMLRAVMRYVAHKHMGKDIEVASTGVYDLRSTTAWLQQLGPESEGKNGEGLWISPEYYTEMAHANGQMIQMGKRNMFETFLMVENPGTDVLIPGKGTPVEYLDGKTLNFANNAFIEGLRDAHYEGGVPVMCFILPDLSAYTMGMYFQYEMNAIALSGLLLGQDPFIQPGVQAYKDVANARSGKPGTEEMLKEMKKSEAALDRKFVI